MLANGKRKDALRVVPIAMSILAIGVVWPQLMHTASRAGTDWNDFVRGATIGFAIGLMLMAVGRTVRDRRY